MYEDCSNHIRFDAENMRLILLDQRLLPSREVFVSVTTVDEVIDALRTMVVRGAPAIGVSAAFGCVLAAHALDDRDSDWKKKLSSMLERLTKARPTAVNLSWAVERMRQLMDRENPTGASACTRLFLTEALRLQEEDISICKRIGENGNALIHEGDCVLTHCNAGALATAGYGTALGVIRAAHEAGKKITVIADETRPFLQGARLTAWELKAAGIPVTVACDNACALLMQRGKIQCVVVGADRIAANGDTANKIGTFGVALLAAHFHLPFYIAAPLSTIDITIPDGSFIPIEERCASEVTEMGGTTIVPQGVPVLNYAFDVTCASLIGAIITEAGVLRPPYTESIARAFATRS